MPQVSPDHKKTFAYYILCFSAMPMLLSTSYPKPSPTGNCRIAKMISTHFFKSRISKLWTTDWVWPMDVFCLAIMVFAKKHELIAGT
jgi:hypothetical protein